MITVHHPKEPANDDHGSIRTNGMWYQSWQSGFHDILKRGFPRPTDGRVILAELHSPDVPDFLHGGSGEVPFLVSHRARAVLESYQLTGFEFAPVFIAKIATKGKRSRRTRGGEPEDSILKARGVTIDRTPILFAVYVSGRADVILDYDTGRHPSGVVSPFELAQSGDCPDLWRPQYHGAPFSAWTFCSNVFKAACVKEGLSNIDFTPLEAFIQQFRTKANKRLEGTSATERP